MIDFEKVTGQYQELLYTYNCTTINRGVKGVEGRCGANSSRRHIHIRLRIGTSSVHGHFELSERVENKMDVASRAKAA